MATALPSSWSDLPPELLGLVLHRLHSFADRVRLSAVCRLWRSNARTQPLPSPMPWLALGNGTFLSIPAGEIHRMPIPDSACCHGSCDNWLFLVHDDGGCSLVNPFCKATLQLPNLPTVVPHKELFSDANFHMAVVPSASLNSTPNLLVVLVTGDGYNVSISFCQPLISSYSVKEGRLMAPIFDIAFFNGKLYAVNPFFILYQIDLSNGFSGRRESFVTQKTESREDLLAWPQDLPLSQEEYPSIRRYLVECDGRLLVVRRWMQIQPFPLGSNDLLETACTRWFDVFEVDFSTDPFQWRRAGTLGRQALFVGKYCSKSLPAEECGAQEDCIYFMCDYVKSDSAVDPLRDSGVYNMKNGTIVPLLSETAAVLPHHAGHWCLSWFFPAEAK